MITLSPITLSPVAAPQVRAPGHLRRRAARRVAAAALAGALAGMGVVARDVPAVAVHTLRIIEAPGDARGTPVVR